MDRNSIGSHLVGLPPATARGLHALFNHLFAEIDRLRGVDPAAAPQPTSDVLPPVAAEPDADTAG